MNIEVRYKDSKSKNSEGSFLRNIYKKMIDQYVKNEFGNVSEQINIKFIDDKRISTMYFIVVSVEHQNKKMSCNMFTNAPGDGRNTWLAQQVAYLLNTLLKIGANNKNYFYAYCNDGSDSGSLAAYNVLTVAELGFLFKNGFTLGDKTFPANDNWDLSDNFHVPSFRPIEDVEDFIQRRMDVRKNRGNTTAYYIERNPEDPDSVTFTGRIDGANNGVSLLAVAVLLNLTFCDSKKKIKTLTYNTALAEDSEKSAEEIRKFVANFNIKNIKIVDNEEIIKLNEEDEKSENNVLGSRGRGNRQFIFRANLMRKFKEKKCLLCGIDIDSFIIASHIKRFADIDNDPELSASEKIRQETDGDNGFWLCANHDKAFEFGYIYADPEKSQFIVAEDQDDAVRKEISNSYSGDGKIKEEYMTEATKNYCLEHITRVTSHVLIK